MLLLIWADEKYNTQKNPCVVFATQKHPGVFHRPKKIPFGENVRPKKIVRTPPPPPSLKYVSGVPGLRLSRTFWPKFKNVNQNRSGLETTCSNVLRFSVVALRCKTDGTAAKPAELAEPPQKAHLLKKEKKQNNFILMPWRFQIFRYPPVIKPWLFELDRKKCLVRFGSF